MNTLTELLPKGLSDTAIAKFKEFDSFLSQKIKDQKISTTEAELVRQAALCAAANNLPKKDCKILKETFEQSNNYFLLMLEKSAELRALLIKLIKTTEAAPTTLLTKFKAWLIAVPEVKLSKSLKAK